MKVRLQLFHKSLKLQVHSGDGHRWRDHPHPGTNHCLRPPPAPAPTHPPAPPVPPPAAAPALAPATAAGATCPTVSGSLSGSYVRAHVLYMNLRFVPMVPCQQDFLCHVNQIMYLIQLLLEDVGMLCLFSKSALQRIAPALGFLALGWLQHYSENEHLPKS